MNGIEKITARITAEADEAAAAVIAEAEKTAEEIRAGYQKKADEAYEARMNEGNTEVRLRAERVERAAKLQSRKDTLALKQSLLECAYDRAKEKLLALPEKDYKAFLASQAGRAAVTGRERIVINSQDRSMGEEIVRDFDRTGAPRRAHALGRERRLLRRSQAPRGQRGSQLHR